MIARSKSCKQPATISEALALPTFTNTTIGNPVPDYAEYFQNYDIGVELPYGALVTLKSGKVKIATENDFVIGIVSSAPAVIAGGADLHWQGYYELNMWGQIVYELQPVQSWTPEEGQTEADRPQEYVPKINPEFDPTTDYVPRSERRGEWTPVGIKGQIRTMVDEKVVEDVFIKPGENGVATTSSERTSIMVMKIIRAFDPELGFAIGLCYVK